MHTNRSAALALIAGSLAGLVVMALHPTGGDVVREASSGGSNTMVAAVHWVAILAQALVLAGALALTVRLRARRDLAIGAYTFFAVATVAVIVAGIASGILGPSALRNLDVADEQRRAMALNDLHYTALINQAFASVHIVLSGIAILLWSGAMLIGRELSRPLAVYGLVLGALLVAGIATGHLTPDIHGFGAVVLGEGIWLTWVAVRLWRAEAG